MKTEAVLGAKFLAIVRKHAAPIEPGPALEGLSPSDPAAALLSSYMLWESSRSLAEEAMARVSRQAVDLNELRVMLEGELVETIGPKYPFAFERATRLRATLNDIFRRQHRTSLDHLRNASRKDQRAYLEGLAEIPPFVAARTLIVAFENPAPMVDDTTTELLVQAGAVDPSATTHDVIAWISRNHRVEEFVRIGGALAAFTAAGWQAAGKGGAKVRESYLARHQGFRAAIERELRRVEDEKRAKADAIARAAEEKRLAELAREEERVRQKREAEEARLKARAAREAERVARDVERAKREAEKAVARAEREKALLKAKAEREKKAKIEEARREREAARRKAEAERKAARARIEAERKAARLKAARLKAARLKAARLKAARLKAEAARKKAAQLKAEAAKKKAAQLKAEAAKKKAARLKAEAAKKKAAKKQSAKKQAAKKQAAKKSAKSASKKSAVKKSAKTKPAKRPSKKPARRRR